MVRSCLFSLAAVCLAMSAPVITMVSLPPQAQAQETPAASPAPTCFSIYPFGQLTLSLQEPQAGQRFFPGDVLNISGSIQNPTHALLPNGRALVRILREDTRVAEEHWHPVVAEFTVPDITIPAASAEAAGEVAFAGSWHVPAFAPAGTYRAEVSLLAADGSPLAGIPYVPNVFGAATTFTVADGGLSAAVAFARDEVLFNKKPFVFRAVPPKESAATPLTIVAPLTAEGSASVPVTVETALYAWTDLEGDKPLLTTTEAVAVSSTKSTPVSFTWDKPQPGVFELVLTAIPTDPQALPSILHVRFYYEGTVPRILHVGLQKTEDGGATVAACFFNSTFGPEGGSGTLQVIAQGEEVQRVEVADITVQPVKFLTLPADMFRHTFTVRAEARDSAGTITDTEEVQFTAPDEANVTPSFSTPVVAARQTSVLGVVVVLIAVALAFFLYRRYKQSL